MKGRQRAAAAVAARRGELDMTQQQLSAAAGVDSKTIGNLESRGRWPIATTRARIEKALGWPSGEMERIASLEPAPAVPPGLADYIRNRSGLPAEIREQAIAVLEDFLSRPPAASAAVPSRRSRRAG